MRKAGKLLIAAGLLAATATGGWMLYVRATPRAPADRVIFLGFDGAAPNLLEPLVEQGKLPTIKKLMQSGAYGHMKTFRPTESGILWTSVATGKTMLKHGVIDWTYVKKAGLQVPYEDTARKVKTFWEILSEGGIRSGTINWWWTFPAAPIDHGYIVTDRYRLMTLIKPAPETVYPLSVFDGVKDLILKRRKEIAEEMRRQGIPQWKEEDASIPMGGSRKTLEAYPIYFAQDISVDRASDYLWENQPVPVFSTYFRLVDVTSHFAWHYIDKDLYDRTVQLEQQGALTPADIEKIDRAFAQVMLPAYEFMDRTIEKYLRRMDDRTVLIICSDHGFNFSNGAYAHGEWSKEAPDGVVFYLGPGVRAGSRIQDAELFDIAPTILYSIGQPIAKDMDGDILNAAIEADFLKQHPPTYVASFETSRRKTGEASAGKTEMDEKVLEDLQTLGYIQSPDEKPSEARPTEAEPAADAPEPVATKPEPVKDRPARKHRK